MNKPLVFILVLASGAGAQDVSEQQAKLERIRAVNLERAATLPSFVADEVAMRYTSKHTDPPDWQFLDKVESEIAVRGADFARQNVRLNGRPLAKPIIPNFNWNPDFGGDLKPLFDPACHTEIVFDRSAEALGKPALIYSFRTARINCFGAFSIKSGWISPLKSYKPAWTGKFVVDEASGALIELQENAREFPKNFGADPFSETIRWDYVMIAGKPYLLPVSVEIFGGFVHERLWHVVAEFKNHRRFEASSNVTFH